MSTQPDTYTRRLQNDYITQLFMGDEISSCRLPAGNALTPPFCMPFVVISNVFNIIQHCVYDYVQQIERKKSEKRKTDEKRIRVDGRRAPYATYYNEYTLYTSSSTCTHKYCRYIIIALQHSNLFSPHMETTRGRLVRICVLFLVHTIFVCSVWHLAELAFDQYVLVCLSV